MGDAQRRAANPDSSHRRSALDQLFPINRALQQRFLDVEQSGLGAFGAGLDDRKVADPDALPLDQFSGAEADLEAGIVFGDYCFDAIAYFIVDARIKRQRGRRADHDGQHNSPLETDPAAIDRANEDECNPPWNSRD